MASPITSYLYTSESVRNPFSVLVLKLKTNLIPRVSNMCAFVPAHLPLRPPPLISQFSSITFTQPPSPIIHRAIRRHATCCQTPQSASALDDIPSSVKLNAVAEALARRKDYAAALRILREMVDTGISLDTPALCAIIDAAVPSPSSLAEILRAVSPPGYSTCSVRQLTGRTDGKREQVDPARASELSVGVGFLTLVGGAVAVEVVEPVVWHHAAGEATSVLIMVISGLIYDRYGGGGGKIWDRIVNGMGRLFSDDPVRRVRVDAAYFVLAYLLGVPWMCFRPDAGQIVKVSAGGGLSQEEVERYLVWLVAGVAVEDELDGRLIESSLNGARELLNKVGEGKRVKSEERIGCAIAEAKELLRFHDRIYGDVVESMLNGGSVGECVSVVANQFG